MKAIKSRIKSVENTMQITKAMELVAASKLRKAKENAEKVQSFFDVIKDAINDICLSSNAAESPFMTENGTGRDCYIVIAGDRGLAGGYNNNLFRLVRDKINFDRDIVLPIGKKSVEQYIRRNCESLTHDYDVIAELGMGDALDIGKLICNQYRQKRFDKVFIVYTKFFSMIRQEPVVEQLLPLVLPSHSERNTNKSVRPITIYEPSPEEVLDKIIPQCVSGIIYSAIRESYASECASRRTAMNAANKNANEMISDLTLHYNRARQAAITQEITEIISGSEAL